MCVQHIVHITFFFFFIRNLHTSRINLVIDNTNIIDHCKSFNILLFKEAIKMNEIKPTLNTGLKTSNTIYQFRVVNSNDVS